ncbi:gas vesicle protein GvpO [Sediminibacillus albus]|uniref:Gas vesicle synthesis protein GvpO n=1 Tax=Sediminibacillus albus TaxID=407036 RepID=A0A1G8Y4C2_9BACI|nr:gas vesicle protein GvpO [Sediminibacillus albus]SDJ97621.1 Gas vesicle synthesis protein GvpO [Sediminibacillus albus]
MKIEQVKKAVEDFFTEHINPPFKITSILQEENGWKLEVEVIEEKEYMKRYAKDHLIGEYEVKVDEAMEVVSYQRKSLRPRSAPLVTEEGG